MAGNVKGSQEAAEDGDRARPGSPTADVHPLPGRAIDESSPGRGDLRRPSPPRSGSLAPGFDHGRFVPGTVIAGRYRIVGLLGRGGMGEVYRADDLELGQSVALKFLPERLAQSPAALERFRGEVRLARQVSHPNVCRVYDIGQVDGQHFLSMEYVDGEDLGLLLRRIGRFPGDRAIQLARQLCLGLAAAHEKGVLHRDLKPANVMVDGRGKLLITDFGLADFACDVRADDVRSGTPAYMAPEQLAGREVSARSDIYSLGLVLHEIFTGKAVWEASSLAELVARRAEPSSSTPSTQSADLDPDIERVIRRCLEDDPRSRPVSAVAVAAALPGGDPLVAAVAAGETPSPAMVAEAGPRGTMRPAQALACLLGFVAVLFVTSAVRPRTLAEQSGLDSSPEVLRVRAADIARELGYTDLPGHVASGFWTNRSYLRLVAERDATTARWSALSSDRPSAVRFWHRWSPSPLRPSDVHLSIVRADDPPQLLPGSLTIHLDKRGRLSSLAAVPPETSAGSEGEPAAGHAPDWSLAFKLAGLELASFEPTEPPGGQRSYCDVTKAWAGTYPSSTHRIVVEAGSHRGRWVISGSSTMWRGPTTSPGAPRTHRARALSPWSTWGSSA
jgi:serine/threonine-protein kinase